MLSTGYRHTTLWTTSTNKTSVPTSTPSSKTCMTKTQAVVFNGSTGDWFRTTVGVRQGCLLSPTLFNYPKILEKIMTDALENHEGTVSIGGRKIRSLRFSNDIDGQASKKEGLENLVKTLETTSTVYGMESSSEKKKNVE